MDQELSSDELRRIAEDIQENALITLGDYADTPSSLIIGDLRNFPRASPDDRAAEIGFEVLREEAERTAAVLYALAAALDRGEHVPRGLIGLVEAAIEAFGSLPRPARESDGPETEPAEGREKPS